MSTSSVEAVQGALLVVQRNVYVVPDTPEKAEVALAGVVIVPPAPLMMLHPPVPTLGAFPARFVEAAHTAVWSLPAAAVVGLARRMITTSSVEAVQGELLIVQRSV